MKKITTLLFTILISTIGFGQFDINDSLQGWYLFTGNTLDSSGNGNDGTLNGATLTTDRFNTANSAYEFDGTNDHIDLDIAFDYPERTVVAWLNAYTITTTAGHVYECDNGNLVNGSTKIVESENNGIDYLATRQGAVPANNKVINENEWYMATISVGADSARHYVNDSLIFTSTLGNGSGVAGHPNSLIGTSYQFDRYFDGKIDDVRIYNRGISWCEVRYLYHGDSILPTISVNGFVLTSSSGVSYQWNLNDTAINGATSINYTALQNGSYTVTVIDSFGCEYTSLPVIITGVGINELAVANPFTIYPNPTAGKFEVRSLELGVEKVEVFDLFGRLVLSTATPQIDMRGYAKGVYVVKAGQAVRKLVIE